MKLRSTADFAELEQKVVGFTGLRILVVHEHVCVSYRDKASTRPVLVYELGTRVFGRMSVISLRIL